MYKTKFSDIRRIFFPNNFYEKYKYLGNVPYDEKSDMFRAIYPLVIEMDKRAKPYCCPRWLLRFLFFFGCDNSIVRVRNNFLYQIHRKLTKNYLFIDYKQKWEEYDLRISIQADDYLHNMANMIEKKFYVKGFSVVFYNEMVNNTVDYNEYIKTMSWMSKLLEEPDYRFLIEDTKESRVRVFTEEEFNKHITLISKK